MFKQLSRSWGFFRGLSGPERWWLIQALLLLPVVAAALRWFGLRRLLARPAHPASLARVELSSTDIAKARSMARIVGIASRHGLYRATCLDHSLLLSWQIRRMGIPGDLRIGVRKAEGRLEAHAWVESCGVVLNDPGGSHRNLAAFDGDILKTGSPPA